MVHLLAARRKLRLAAAVDDRRLGTQTFGRAHGIHGHVAAAYHYHALADIYRCIVQFVIGVHQIGARQELVGRDHTVQILALDAHEARKTRTRPDEDGIKALVLQQGIDRDGAADDDVGLELHAQPAQRRDLARHDLILRQAELGNTVNQHAAHLVQRLEYRHIVPHLCQIARAGQTCGAAAHDRNMVSVLLDIGGCLIAMGQMPVADVTLQLADGDRLALDTQHARALALCLLRADAPADARQRAVRGNHRGRRGHVSAHKIGYECRNVYIDGACLDTTRPLARKAARRLQTRLLVVIPVAYLFEICGAYGCILLTYRHARNLICHSTHIYVSR